MTANRSIEIPESWLSIELGEVIDYGKTTKVEPEAISPETWVLELEDIEKDSSRLIQCFTFADRKSKSTKNVFKTGDVLYGKLRPYLNKVLFADSDGVCTTEIVPLQSNTAVHGRYLFHWLRHPTFVAYVNQVSHGVNMPRLGTDAGKKAPFILTPMPEQKRIADKLDTVLARVDACRERLDRVPAILKRFRQSVLAVATAGKLTEDWRRTTGLQNDSSEDGRLPDGWLELTIGTLTTDLRYGTSKKCDLSPRGRAVLRIPNIGEHGKIIDGDLKYAEFEASEVSKLALRAGDLLVVRSNGSVDLVGKTGLVTELQTGMLFAGYLMRLRVDPKVALPAYVQMCLSSPAQRQRIESTSRSTSGVNNINSDELRALPVLMPSLDEQLEITRRVELLFAYADRLEKRFASARDAADRFTPALLAKAFRGELVPQDPNDEPAAELMKRLARQRSGENKTAKGSRTKRVAPVPLSDEEEPTSVE
ncbi:type I restriction modification DNA specificity domain protein [Burkholderia pseudomallei]|nr:type I restriction modification DNA specificity domain protein [Burkholderia pseudomallei]